MKWTREDTIVALQAYFSIPFNRVNRNNTEVIHFARIIDKTPSSLTMKIGNFGSLDPELRARGIQRLSGATQLDNVIWNEYSGHREKLQRDSERIISELLNRQAENQVHPSMTNFEEYLGKIGFNTESIQRVQTIISLNNINHNIQISLNNTINNPEVIIALSEALARYFGFRNYQLFKNYCGTRHSYPLALLYASRIYKTVPMISAESIFEIVDKDVIKRFYLHALDYQEITGGIYDINEIATYGRQRFYSAALKMYIKYLENHPRP